MDALTQRLADWGYLFCKDNGGSGLRFTQHDYVNMTNSLYVLEMLDGDTVVYSCGRGTVSDAHVGARAKRYIAQLENPTVAYGD